jgi:hypothetical protein
MRLRPKTWLFAAVAAAVLGTASNARALLILSITENGGGPITIFDGGPGDLDGIVNGQIDADTTLVNSSLFDYAFVGSLGATSNALFGSGNDEAQVSQNGEVRRISGAGAVSITIVAEDDGFTFPEFLLKTLDSAAGGTFRNVQSTDTQTFTSTFTPSGGGASISSPTLSFSPPSTGVGPFGVGGTAAKTPLGAQPSVFTLTTTTVISLAPNGSFANPPSSQFNGAGSVTGIIPEPASVLLLGSALPLLAFGWVRRRRSAT